MDEIIQMGLQKYGITAAIALYIFKTIWDLFSGNLQRYIKSIDANTAAIDKLTKDMRVFFMNLKEVRDKLQMGPLVKPIDMDIDGDDPPPKGNG